MLAAECGRSLIITPCETTMTENSFLQSVIANTLRNRKGQPEDGRQPVELGRQRSSSALMSMIAGLINSQGTKRPILVFDEFQALRYGNKKIIHVIRNLSDRSMVPVICAGRPEGFDILNETEFLDYGWRTREQVELQPIVPEDLLALLGDLAECEYSDGAKKLLYERCGGLELRGGSYGALANDLYEIERQAKRSKITKIEPEHIRQWRG